VPKKKLFGQFSLTRLGGARFRAGCGIKRAYLAVAVYKGVASEKMVSVIHV